MTDALHLTPREVAQVEAALDDPTTIDPADIRPGDTFRLTHEATCERLVARSQTIIATSGDSFDAVQLDGMTWFLVHRPDPDAEAVEALAKNVFDISHPDAYDRENIALALAALREQGWDVVRRAES